MREIGDRRGEGNALWDMSLAFDTLGERARAALEIFVQIEDPRVEWAKKKLTEWGAT